VILHKVKKHLYSDDRWMRYITKKSVRDFNKPVDAAVQRAVIQAAIKTQLDAERRAPVPPRPRKKKGKEFVPVEVMYCHPCKQHFTRRDMAVHTHSVPMSRVGAVYTSG
jgi:hypothetical protein